MIKKEYSYWISYIYKNEEGKLVFNQQPYWKMNHPMDDSDVWSLIRSLKEEYSTDEVIVLSVSCLGKSRRLRLK